MDIVNKILQDLGIAESARAIYQDLLEHGSTPARVIASRLSMTRPSVYDQLKELARLGLISERDIDGKTEFAVHDVADLERLVGEKRERLENLSHEFAAVEKQLADKLTARESIEPKIKFLSDTHTLMRSMHDMLWDESITLYVVWPYEEMLRVFGREKLTDFNRKRIRNEIHMRSIWSYAPDRKKNAAHIWEKEDWGVERRIAPKGLAPRMGYAIYDSKVIFISSSAEAFGFVVQSEDFADLMRQQFEVLWTTAKPEKKKR